jgi:hypothetical protein
LFDEATLVDTQHGQNFTHELGFAFSVAATPGAAFDLDE